MLSNLASLAGSIFIVHALAQTPPGTSPVTNNKLTVKYASNEVTPGIKLAQSGRSEPCEPLPWNAI